jgi:hypothetical protein
LLVEQWAKLSLGFLASYSEKFNFLILLKFDEDTSFNLKVLLIELISEIKSFYFHVVGSTLKTTFSLDAKVQILCGI